MLKGLARALLERAVEADGELGGEAPEVGPLCNQLKLLLVHGLRSRAHPSSWLHFAAPGVTSPLALLQVCRFAAVLHISSAECKS